MCIFICCLSALRICLLILRISSMRFEAVFRIFVNMLHYTVLFLILSCTFICFRLRVRTEKKICSCRQFHLHLSNNFHESPPPSIESEFGEFHLNYTLKFTKYIRFSLFTSPPSHLSFWVTVIIGRIEFELHYIYYKVSLPLLLLNLMLLQHIHVFSNWFVHLLSLHNKVNANRYRIVETIKFSLIFGRKMRRKCLEIMYKRTE